MPKTRLQKEEILAKTIDRMQRAQSIVFVTVQGVKVEELEGIRDALFNEGLNLQVAKNSLCKRALQELSITVPSEMLDQSLGMVFSYHDAVASAKAITPFLKTVETLKVVGGVMEGEFITPAQVEALSKLPSRDQLLGQLVGTMAAPLSGLVNVLHGTVRGLVYALAQIRDQKA